MDPILQLQLKPCSDIRIIPVILAGGQCRWPWPLSPECYAKQFVPLVGTTTLFQAAASRLSGATDHFTFAQPRVLTNALFRFFISEQLTQKGIDPHAISVGVPRRVEITWLILWYLSRSSPVRKWMKTTLSVMKTDMPGHDSGYIG